MNISTDDQDLEGFQRLRLQNVDIAWRMERLFPGAIAGGAAAGAAGGSGAHGAPSALGVQRHDLLCALHH